MEVISKPRTKKKKYPFDSLTGPDDCFEVKKKDLERTRVAAVYHFEKTGTKISVTKEQDGKYYARLA